MKLYLVRHAEAIERSGTMPDANRYLTPKGRSAFRKIARRSRKLGSVLVLIFSGHLVRAVQTAEIIAERLKHDGPVVVANAGTERVPSPDWPRHPGTDPPREAARRQGASSIRSATRSACRQH